MRKYVQCSSPRGCWHIIFSISRGRFTTECGRQVSRFVEPETPEKLHPKAKVCKICQKAETINRHKGDINETH